MADQPITLHMPEALYLRIKRDAELRGHSIEDEALDTLSAVVAPEAPLSSELQAAVDQLDVLDDAALERAARRHLDRVDARRLETLHLKRQRDGLDLAETAEMDRLAGRYERIMVIRARAALLLSQRGHDVTSGPAQLSPA